VLSLIPEKYRLTVAVTGILLVLMGLTGLGVTIYIKSLKSKLYGQIYAQFEDKINTLKAEKDKLIQAADSLRGVADSAGRERLEAEREIVYKTNAVAKISNFGGLLDFAKNLPGP